MAKKYNSWENFTVIFAVVFVIALGWYIWSSGAETENKSVGIANPAAVICRELGYKYKIVDTSKGQIGICVMPNGQRCNGWKFYSGECGVKFNYCTQNGYDTITMTDGKDAFSSSYAVCAKNDRVVGSVAILMNLSEKLKPGCQNKTINSITESTNWFRKLKSKVSK